MSTSIATARIAPAPARVYTTEEIKAFLQVPFRKCDLAWRILNKSQDKTSARIIPYAPIGAYHSRLNVLLGTEGWDEILTTTTSNNIQREKYINRASVLITTGKILVCSTITLKDLGTKSSNGESWADDENGSTRASAQATRRACALFGLGKYFNTIYDAHTFWAKLDQKGHFDPPHFSVLPDFAIHPDELEEATRYRAAQQENSKQGSKSHANRTSTQPVQSRSHPARAVVAAAQQSQPESVTKTHVSGFAPAAQAQQPTQSSQSGTAGTVVLGVFRTPDIQKRLNGYREQLSVALITSVVVGIAEMHADGRMQGNVVDDAFFNLDRAVDLVNRIGDMEPMLPNDSTLPSILQTYSAKTLFDLKSLGDLKAVSRTVKTIFQSEQERQHGGMAA